MQLDLDRLTAACSDSSLDGGVTIRSALEPLAGATAPVKPPTYAGATAADGPRYQRERRWRGAGQTMEIVDAIVIDNVPSQANRAEHVLERMAADLGLPELVLDLTCVGPLPAHLPRQLSSFQFAHRAADAYLRDAELDGTPFPKTEIGTALLAATADRAEPLFRLTPQALVYGFWQSHLGKSGSQAKLARSWRSEIVGYRPADGETRQLGLKGDALNLATEEEVHVDEVDASRWSLGKDKPAGASKPKKTKLSELGHGQVPVGGDGKSAPLAVSFAAIEQRSTVSLPDLRRVSVGDPHNDEAGRALLAALALVGHLASHSGAFSLRSGADLRTIDAEWTWLGASGDEGIEAPTLEQAVDLFRAAVGQAEAAGLPVGAGWDPRVIELTPNTELIKVIRATYPEVD